MRVWFLSEVLPLYKMMARSSAKKLFVFSRYALPQIVTPVKTGVQMV